MEKLENLSQKISTGSILALTTFQKLDIEDALCQRDSFEFEHEWLRVFHEIETLLEIQPLHQDDLQQVNMLREKTYKRVYEHTQYSEICAYVSDDFEMISKALILSYNDSWLNALWNEYKSGVFPCGVLKKKTGTLSELIDCDESMSVF